MNLSRRDTSPTSFPAAVPVGVVSAAVSSRKFGRTRRRDRSPRVDTCYRCIDAVWLARLVPRGVIS
jgi:hypothetical protein